MDLNQQIREEWATPRSSDAERGRDGRRGPESQRQGGPCLMEQLLEWPTPTAASYGTSNNGSPRDGRREAFATAGKPSLEGCAREDWPTPTARDWRSTPASPETHARNARPLSEVVGLSDWPTPTASDAKDSGAAGYSTESGRHPGTTLTDAAVGPRGPLAEESGNTPGSPREWYTSIPRDEEEEPGPGDLPQDAVGKLNPDWVEALMGAPPGWTDLPDETVSALWATRTRRTSRS